MSLLGVFVDVVLPVAAIAVVGGIVGRRLDFPADALGRAAYFLFTPALVFRSVAGSDLAGGEVARILAVALTVFVLNLALAVAWGRARGDDRPTTATAALASAVSNQGNLGLPIAELAFGRAGLRVAVVTYAAGTLLAAVAEVIVGRVTGAHRGGHAGQGDDHDHGNDDGNGQGDDGDGNDGNDDDRGEGDGGNDDDRGEGDGGNDDDRGDGGDGGEGDGGDGDGGDGDGDGDGDGGGGGNGDDSSDGERRSSGRRRAGRGVMLRAAVRSPILWAAAVGTVVNVADVGLPDVVTASTGTLADAAVPCMLVVLGLQFRRPGRGDVTGTLAVSVNRLLIGPLIAWPTATALGLTGVVRAEVVTATAMPSAVLVTILASRVGGRPDLAVQSVVVSTLLSLVTLTALLSLVT